ncbi:MAG: hypothetical protein A3G43_07075 [Ignavibacteria bacterium RIFCSPLOWO2_12_FULL_56_21]|nr:MAG: hypothetical protein A3G43_07075 [Ignavibacteria bacterium RIFCSPLOWO2_12_FULL_56_21]
MPQKCKSITEIPFNYFGVDDADLMALGLNHYLPIYAVRERLQRPPGVVCLTDTQNRARKEETAREC